MFKLFEESLCKMKTEIRFPRNPTDETKRRMFESMISGLMNLLILSQIIEKEIIKRKDELNSETMISALLYPKVFLLFFSFFDIFIAKKERINENESAKLCKLSEINIRDPEISPPSISKIVIRRFKNIVMVNLKTMLRSMFCRSLSSIEF
jgi:hypothetical protein